MRAEIAAYSNDDISYLTRFMKDQPLRSVQSELDNLRNQGLFYVPEIDFDSSSWNGVRLINENKIEVDTCEYWSGDYYNRTDSTYISTVQLHLIPQTITIERFTTGWFITLVAFYNPPHFCG
jgi:hypothetical protein